MKGFLLRCEQTSLLSAVTIAALSTAVWADALWAGAVLAGAAWMLLNLRVWRWLWVGVLETERLPAGVMASRRAGAGLLFLKGPGLYGLGYLLLKSLPATGLAVGLSLPFTMMAMMALKATGHAIVTPPFER